DLIFFFPWAADKLVVVPSPVGEEFQFTPKSFKGSWPQILHVGTRSNKNLECVIEALDGINCKLDIIGNLTEE
ncbi:glycosyltransferase family 1 protein, partial [Bacteroides nordii]|nr:glycosyltransferase family 1 protein [Bacteroides nordii]